MKATKVKQHRVKMTLKTRLGFTAATVGTVGIVLVMTMADAENSRAFAAGDTAPPPEPFASQPAPADAQGNYPPAGFDPENKAATDGQPAPTQQQWPVVTGNGETSKDYPPQEGIDLTPAPKAAAKKPQLKYPDFPSVAWPENKVKLPEYSQFPSVEWSKNTTKSTNGRQQYPPFPSVPWPKDAKGAPVSPSLPPAAKWGQPPQPWSGPVWQRQLPVPGQAGQNKTVEERRKEMKRQWDAIQAERKAATNRAPARQAESMATDKAEMQKSRAAWEAQRAEQEKIIKAREMAVKRQWEAQQAELQKARAAFEAHRTEQEKVFKARQSAMKRQWENQQAEMQRARAAYEQELKRRAAESQKVFDARQAYQRRQFEAFQAEMQKARAAQQAAAKANITKMLESQSKEPVPSMPPKVPQQVVPQNVAPQQAAPAVPDARAPRRGSVPQGNQQQYRRPNGSNGQGAARGSWGTAMQPRMGQQWQYGNQMHPAWRYNPYGPQYQAPYQPWPRPYPYGPGAYRPR